MLALRRTLVSAVRVDQFVLDLHLTAGFALLNLQLDRLRALLALLPHSILILDDVRIGTGVVIDPERHNYVAVASAEPVVLERFVLLGIQIDLDALAEHVDRLGAHHIAVDVLVNQWLLAMVC